MSNIFTENINTIIIWNINNNHKIMGKPGKIN